MMMTPQGMVMYGNQMYYPAQGMQYAPQGHAPNNQYAPQGHASNNQYAQTNMYQSQPSQFNLR
jgi:hypothetical protein